MARKQNKYYKLMKLLFQVLFLSFIFSSCELTSLERDLRDKEVYRNSQSPYSGFYTGTYNGDDTGTLQITIYRGIGKVTRSSNNGFTEDFTCYIDNKGNITANSSTKFNLSGSLDSKSGTWSIESLKRGTWVINKVN